MTRILPLLIAASLIASPSLAGGFTFGLPTLSFPAPDGTVTQSTASQPAPARLYPQD